MRRRDLLATLAFLLVACGGRPRPVDLPAPVSNATVGVGDVFEMRIVREDNLPTMFTVAPDGTVDLPYIKRVKVAGLEPQQIAEIVRKRLVEAEILTDPIVSVSIKEYNSKRVEVLGEVQRSGSLRFESGMTLLRAISLAGGFNQMAARDKVTIRRQVGDKTRAVTVSVEDIIDNAIPDVPLQAGDSINIPQRVW
ncbi:polysaccharide biosynthesis/export family protein [Polyangium spumosum]|uniref:Polysaccharide export protein n=1 Tax=Polyangium spumosum TaxID=889282 RepID=A0A6N7PSL1_9BACT|nr:polysaccharide biosynthesis/export family protein [Polyangium spumosum]MRG93235.1 polysaccharide export protein [Polyangium spumosum]